MADRRWSAGETVALMEAWRPLYNRRRCGESDVWVPPNQRSRPRATGSLTTEDWRAVATSVNAFRTKINVNPNRTHKQCKKRLERLRRRFGDKLLAPPSWFGFVPVVCNNTAGGCGQAMEVHGGGAAGGQARGRGGLVVADGGSAEAGAEENGGAVMGVLGAAAANASDDVAVAVEDGGTATATQEALGSGATSEDPPSGPVDGFTAAVTDFLGGRIPKKRRIGASTSTSAGAGDGRANSVKEELVREANARRARVGEGRAPAPAGGFAAEMAAALGEVLAAEAIDVAVVAKVLEMIKGATTMYSEITMKRIELQRQILTTATTGGAAVPEPDAVVDV